VVEIDDYLTHGDRLTFERDRRKQTVYALHGILTIRITEQTLRTAPATIRKLISDRSGRITAQ
jgi:predicted transcriptional regulator of viral defense system